MKRKIPTSFRRGRSRAMPPAASELAPTTQHAHAPEEPPAATAAPSRPRSHALLDPAAWAAPMLDLGAFVAIAAFLPGAMLRLATVPPHKTPRR